MHLIIREHNFNPAGRGRGHEATLLNPAWTGSVVRSKQQRAERSGSSSSSRFFINAIARRKHPRCRAGFGDDVRIEADQVHRLGNDRDLGEPWLKCGEQADACQRQQQKRVPCSPDNRGAREPGERCADGLRRPAHNMRVPRKLLERWERLVHRDATGSELQGQDAVD